MVATRQMTVEEFEALPDDDWWHELIGGELVRMLRGGLVEGGVARGVGQRLGIYVNDHDLGLVVDVDVAFVFENDPPTVSVP